MVLDTVSDSLLYQNGTVATLPAATNIAVGIAPGVAARYVSPPALSPPAFRLRSPGGVTVLLCDSIR